MAATTIDVGFDPEDLSRLDALAEALGIERGALIQQCLRIGMTRIEAKPRKFAKQDRRHTAGQSAPSVPDFDE